MVNDPPRRLKSRVVRSLRAQGLIARPRPGWPRAVMAVVGLAAVVALVALWPRAPGRSFVLLLYEDSAFVRTRPVAELVAEYGAWAAGLRREGTLVLGEQLDDASYPLGPGDDRSLVAAPGSARITGLFVIRAGDPTAALAIARTCPHLRYGGRVVVRPVSG